MSLTFDDFQRINKERCEQVFHPVDDWTENDWALALAGEVGELCNLLKKKRRGDDVNEEDIDREAADIYAYLDLFLTRRRRITGNVIAAKFNEVSRLKNFIRFIHFHDPPRPTEEKRAFPNGFPQALLPPPTGAFPGVAIIKKPCGCKEEKDGSFDEMKKAIEEKLPSRLRQALSAEVQTLAMPDSKERAELTINFLKNHFGIE